MDRMEPRCPDCGDYLKTPRGGKPRCPRCTTTAQSAGVPADMFVKHIAHRARCAKCGGATTADGILCYDCRRFVEANGLVLSDSDEIGCPHCQTLRRPLGPQTQCEHCAGPAPGGGAAGSRGEQQRRGQDRLDGAPSRCEVRQRGHAARGDASEAQVFAAMAGRKKIQFIRTRS